MKATGTLVCFPKPATPRKSKANDKKKPKPTSTALDWIRNGYQFPGKPIPPPVPP